MHHFIIISVSRMSMENVSEMAFFEEGNHLVSASKEETRRSRDTKKASMLSKNGDDFHPKSFLNDIIFHSFLSYPSFKLTSNGIIEWHHQFFLSFLAEYVDSLDRLLVDRFASTSCDEKEEDLSLQASLLTSNDTFNEIQHRLQNQCLLWSVYKNHRSIQYTCCITCFWSSWQSSRTSMKRC